MGSPYNKDTALSPETIEFNGFDLNPLNHKAITPQVAHNKDYILQEFLGARPWAVPWQNAASQTPINHQALPHNEDNTLPGFRGLHGAVPLRN